jgi:hypothetical protein
MIMDARTQSTTIGYRVRPMQPNQSIDERRTGSIRAAFNSATWRTYLPEDCVAAMIKNGWDWST